VKSTPFPVETHQLIDHAKKVVQGLVSAHDRRNGMTFNTDWERDERSIGESLKAWEKQHRWTLREAAWQLRLPLNEYRALRKDTALYDSHTFLFRRMMVLVDAHERSIWGLE
jgi:hypothetical protein